MRRALLLAFVVIMPLTAQSRPPEVPFRIQLIDGGASETAAWADFNNDGRADIASGEFWFAAPGWTKHRIREIAWNGQYIDNFTDLPLDVDEDGFVDLIQFGYFSNAIIWAKNPGLTPRPWVTTAIERGFPTEFARLVDLDGDGRARELLPQFDRLSAPLKWYEVQRGTWTAHTISDRSHGHGIGAGDLNGDGRTDVLTPRGWFEAPVDVRTGTWRFHDTDWSLHPIPASGSARESTLPTASRAAQFGIMHTIDVNGDGRTDVLTSMAHDYGVCWFAQEADGSWTQRVIDNTWSQAHASELVDLNGDGQLDVITGKRYLAHNGADPGEREPLGLYWCEFRRPGRPAPQAGGVSGAGAAPVWTRHIIDYGSRLGAGMQIGVRDMDGDGDLDLAVGGKAGLFLAENLSAPVRR